MLKTLLLALASATLLSACTARVEGSDPKFSETAGVLIYAGRPFSGVKIEHYPTGDLYKEMRYERGRLEGESREYTVGHRLRARWNYRNGVKDGWQYGWYVEGPKRFESHFKDGVLEGVQTEWHQNGVVFRRQVFVDGVETDRKVLYEGAEIYSNYSKRDGRKFGLDGGSLCMETKREGEK